ncbi:putative ankyrin repeat protein L62 [Zancudomyces culisetae]|uniref:Putative ankyrin repeat protein L62 n=1 Tax=Zancudomyces culisetae TaxID=1213189 RepID=A0A1R1PHK3_ZANCU|nr:putative ankyrin repeat protein L62 [Zancudomyces culisetae]|eukprot:OMH80456.1 putative ankyrin repeat protein L62 [Zancudomyces culisetae]
MKKYPTSATELSLKEAIGSGNVGLVKKFVKLGMDITKCSFDAIELACIRVCLEMVRFLIKSGVKTDEDRPVVSGLLNRAEQIVLEYLVFGKFDFDINGPRNTIEGSASEKNRYSRVLECLCEYGLGFMQRVSESGNVEALKNLFSQGWEIDPKSISDALPTACELGSLEMVRALIKQS